MTHHSLRNAPRASARGIIVFGLLASCIACSKDDKPADSSSGAGTAAGGAGNGGTANTAGTTSVSGGTGGMSSSTAGHAGSPSAAGRSGGPGQSGSGGSGGGGGSGASAGSGGGAGANNPEAGAGGAAGQASAGASGTGPSDGVPAVIASGVRWVGRVDTSQASAEHFSWSGTGFVATVAGDSISVKLRSEGSGDAVYFQPLIDGMPLPRFSVATSDADKTVVLGTGLGAVDHRVELYRETEGKPGFPSSTFLGFASGTPKTPPAYSGRLIEIIGDSISAGYGNLGSEQHPNGSADPNGGCHFTTETESAYMTYGAVAARELNADASIIAASGWGIYSDNGGNRSNVLPNVYGNTIGSQESPAWDFALVPQAVVINLGTNDFSANMNLDRDSFSDAYTAFVTDIRKKYPDALILCAIGPMLYGTGLDNAKSYIQGLVADLNTAGDDKVKVLDFGQQNASAGTGCDWHPNVTEDARMATILVNELKNELDW